MKNVPKPSPTYKEVQETVNNRVRVAGIVAGIVSLLGIIAISLR